MVYNFIDGLSDWIIEHIVSNAILYLIHIQGDHGSKAGMTDALSKLVNSAYATACENLTKLSQADSCQNRLTQ